MMSVLARRFDDIRAARSWNCSSRTAMASRPALAARFHLCRDAAAGDDFVAAGDAVRFGHLQSSAPARPAASRISMPFGLMPRWHSANIRYVDMPPIDPRQLPVFLPKADVDRLTGRL